MTNKLLAGALVAQALLMPWHSADAQTKKAAPKNTAAKQNYSHVWTYAEKHLAEAIKVTPEAERYPRSSRENGNLVWVRSGDWTSGFFPGSLWLVYNQTRGQQWLAEAKRRTAALEKEQYNKTTHDLGFMLYIPYGTGLHLEGKKDAALSAEYKKVLIQTARTLCTRYSPKTKTIKSWDFVPKGKEWQFPVIIDNMMNLELLFWASRETGESSFRDIAIAHANTTLAHHFRDDNSSFHVVDYDSTTGAVRWRGTHQGYADNSAWARGQAWGLYGYTVMYRETKDNKYLDQAQKIAGFIFGNRNLPADQIPFWDYNAPDIPNTARDASAAAITASALLEMSTYVAGAAKANYLNKATGILNALTSKAYLAEPGTNNNFLLMHSTGNKPGNSEVDVPLNYADYYLLEAVTRQQRLQAGKPVLSW